MELTRFLLVFILCLISRTLAFETKKLSQPLKQNILTLKESVREPSETRIRHADEEEDEFDIKCGDLPTVHCGHYTGTGHEMGQTWHLQCDLGCHLVGSGEITCLGVPDPFHHVAIWDHMQGMSKCEKTCCGVPTPPAHGYIVGTNFNLYQNVTVKCDKGYTLKGSDVLQCLPIPYPKACGMWVYVTQWTDSYCVPNPIDTRRDPQYLVSSGGVKETPALETESEDSVCLQPKKTGPCKARMERYYYNYKNKQCEMFIYGGCQRNDNNFKTLEECEDKCKN